MHYAMIVFTVLTAQACVHAAAPAADTPPPAADTPPPAAAAPIAGLWHLVTVAGEELPTAPVHDGRRLPIEVAGAAFMIAADGTFTMTMTYRNTATGDGFSRGFEGTYSVTDGAAYRFDWTGAGATRVWIEDGRLIMDNEGVHFAYARRPAGEAPAPRGAQRGMDRPSMRR
jgi:hypothetical protein